MKAFAKRNYIAAILMMSVYTFVFLGLEYHFIQSISSSIDEHGTVLAQNFVLGASALGFFLYAFISRVTKNRRTSSILSASLTLICAICIALIESLSKHAALMLFGVIEFIILGFMGGMVYHISAKILGTNEFLARQVGVSYALSIVLQLLLNNLLSSAIAQAVILAVFLTGLCIMLIITSRSEIIVQINENKSEISPIVNKRSIIAGVVLALLIACMASIFSTLDNAVTLEHAAGKMNITEWPRGILALSGLCAGFIFDLRNRKFMNMVMYCVMMLSTICVAVLRAGGPFLIGLIVFYLSSGFFVVYFTASFMELSASTSTPALWAGMGRTANNLSAAFLSDGSLALISSGDSMLSIVTALVLFVAVSILMAIYISKKNAISSAEIDNSAVNLMQADRFDSFCEKYKLTEREKDVFDALVNTENSIQEISDALYISRRTCQRHITSIYEKLGVKSRMGLYQVYLTGENRRDSIE